MQENERSETELLDLGRAVRNTFRDVETQERRNASANGRARPPRIPEMHQSREFLIKVGRLVAKHEMDPVQFATVVRRMGSRNNARFFFSSYGSPKVVERALKESELHTEAVAGGSTPRSKPGEGEDAVVTKKLPAEVEMTSRISSLKTFLHLRNGTDEMTEDNIKTMSDFMMNLDPLACMILSRGDPRVSDLHYAEALAEVSTRPDILAAIRSMSLNWKGFLD